MILAGNDMENVTKKFIETVNYYKLINKKENLLVMVSGGRDSVALLYLIYKLFSKNLHLFHLNHLIRENSSKDESFVKELAAKLDLKITTLKFDVKKYADEHKLSIQDAARKIRYRLALETAESNNLSKIATGHQADDNIETFLYRLVKGSGLTGLKAIPIKRGPFIRPLLEITREEITGYLKSNRYEYIDDPSNVKTVYARNKIRLELIPKLLEINPSFLSTAQSTIDIINEDDQYIDTAASGFFNKASLTSETANITLKYFFGLDRSIQRRFIRLAVQHVKGDLLGIEYKHIRDIQANADKPNFQMDLPDNLVVFSESGNLIFALKTTMTPVRYESVESTIPGEVYIEELDLSIENKLVEPLKTSDPSNVVLDYQKIKPPLTIRQWDDGDRFMPLGMKDQKKLHDFFIDRKIPKRLRSNIPIVEDSEKIIWIAGMEIDERVKVTDNTKQGLKLKIAPGKL